MHSAIHNYAHCTNFDILFQRGSSHPSQLETNTTRYAIHKMAAAVSPPPAPSIPTKHASHPTLSCPSCGTSIELNSGEAEAARKKIFELEAQMEFLKEKATAAGMSAYSPIAPTKKLTHDSGQMCRLRRPDPQPEDCTRPRTTVPLQPSQCPRLHTTLERRPSTSHGWCDS